jgi:ATP-dependent DNA helicase RecQ
VISLNKTIIDALLPLGAIPKPEQKKAIECLLKGKNALCLMPTGSGKSFVYQYVAAHLGKTALVLSPLRALMLQQDEIMSRSGFTSSALHRVTDYKKYNRVLCRYAKEGLPQFLYISPERSASDGFLAHVLKKQRDRIGLIVVDEAHCISQWGDTFRPLYRLIPAFLNDVFGSSYWPPILCLTATLKTKDETEICRIFNIQKTAVVRSPLLRRTNINISVETLSDQDHKERRLEKLLKAHAGEKVIVYAHLVKGQYGTRALNQQFRDKGFMCDYFDAAATEAHKVDVLNGFSTGRIPIIFATSAFGMGMHIPDIRVVVHYLLPESIEQYYQEIGRAGRDGLPSHAYLLFTETNLKVRRFLIRRSLPTASQLDKIYENNFAPSSPIPLANYDPYRDNSENSPELSVFVALLEAGVLQVRSKGVSNIKSFTPTGKRIAQFRTYLNVSRIGALSKIATVMKQDPSIIVEDLYRGIVDGTLLISAAPKKVLFYTHAKSYQASRDPIVQDFATKRERREDGFEELVSVIQSSDPEAGIYRYLKI